MTAAIPDLRHHTAVVTGATGGMGQIIAATLINAGVHVVTVARDSARADTLRARIGVDNEHRLDVIAGDLSRREDLLTAARIIEDRYEQIHILVNNAGAHFPDHRMSSDGVEMHVALDYLAAYGLMTHLDASLRRGRARIVNVASDTLNDTRRIKLAGKPRPPSLDLTHINDLADLNPRTGFVPFEAYTRAKLMTVTAGYALTRSFAPDGVTVNAVHPGIVATGIVDDLIPRSLRPFGTLIRRAMLTPADGAATALRIATDPRLAGVTGRYFNQGSVAVTPPISHDAAVQRKLLTLSEAHFAR
ncbi:retinol dehydrogenase [Actinoplanes cyaneus]|uniref:Retinol dehydrogenase n=1 Tax=Actinoplanes cyaneus TaxID=52696 RepID=A0A919IF32_9ACTN|nr:SDR family NAD(P)-dependent oxidoreductase [Actinoplanes cyaneus]MCW2142713.1 NAD(P)-dependent dehydrogenase, short-chain alcohol dehydrogenase family [Actinoplanes cyaneus]GID62263.1 retinol dehydrogenase [Actinoplanes cyaneus]